MRRGGPRGIPNWLLALVTLSMLGGAAALFLQPDGGPAPAAEDSAPAGDDSGSKGELRLPADDAAADTRRRGEIGRERADADAADTDDDASDDADPSDDTGRPATFRNLDGVTIALSPASATATEGAGTRVRVGPLRTTCASERVVSALAVEIALLDRLDKVLTTAGAKVSRLDDPATRQLACRDTRAATLGTAEWFVVVAAVQPPDAAARVIAARAAGTLPAAEQQRSLLLAQELGAALELPVARTTAKQAAADAVAALTAGALDLPGGGAGALYLLTSERRSGTQLDELATQLATGLAGVVTRDTTPDTAPAAN